MVKGPDEALCAVLGESPAQEGHGALTAAPALEQRQDSDQALSQIHYWTPPVPIWRPMKAANSSLRIAAVVSDKLYQGLRFEGDVLLLTPRNGRRALEYAQPDFLLVESSWGTATGHWYLAQCTPTPEKDALVDLVRAARELGIPTVYWITEGHEYHGHYKDFAAHFDAVFCADPQEVELLAGEGIQSRYLPPCVQPALYNPFRLHEHYDAADLGVLYDGWAELDRKPEDYALLGAIRDYGLSIVESRYKITRNRKQALPEYEDCLLGCLTPQGRIAALKYARAYITFASTFSTSTTQQWMSLEAVASRLPVVHYGELAEQDIRRGLVLEHAEEEELLLELLRFREDDLYRERQAHKRWRQVYQCHTFSHRIRDICGHLGIGHDWEEYPRASLITPTYRRELLPRCLATFERQTYPDRELILVFNGDRAATHEDLGVTLPRSDVTLCHVPGDRFAGACLNVGHGYAQGQYCFRVDDDDHYGANYVLDMMLSLRAVEADLFGKPPCPFVFEGAKTVYLKKRASARPFSITSGITLTSSGFWLGGNSISGRYKVFRTVSYPDHSVGAADSLFALNSRHVALVATVDNLNLVAERRLDISSHTWRGDSDRLRENTRTFDSLEELMI